MIKGTAAILFLIFFLGACRDTTEPLSTAEQQDQEIQAYLMQDTTIEAFKDETGFYYIPLKDTITANAGDILSIYYTAWTLDSVQVAQHQQEDGAPVILQRGDSTVYPLGLDYALEYMSEGDSFGFVFPSQLAYRDISFSDLLPPGSIVLFNVKVVKAENQGTVFNRELKALDDYIESHDFDTDTAHTETPVVKLSSGLRVYKPEPDTVAPRPVPGNIVGINWTGYFLDGSSLPGGYSGSNIFEFELGAGEVINGLDEGVQSMRLGERATFLMPSELAYGPSVAVLPAGIEDLLVEKEVIPTYASKIPPFTPLIFEVELRTIE